MLRYSKGKALSIEVGEWQSAYLFGYLSAIEAEKDAQPECKLCVAINAYSGSIYAAPSDAVSRFHEMETACATIAERWPTIAPPSGAVLED